ncbi:MAG: aminomethyl-transferring glycine dehydrogenase [Acidimicrobiales bacterium]
MSAPAPLPSFSLPADTEGHLDDGEFEHRHIGVDGDDRAPMLRTVGAASIEALIARAVPASIRSGAPLPVAPAVPEHRALDELAAIARRNRRCTSLIGMGYHGTIMPAVLRRTVLESPAWYTAYTPYQPEISQGRLEALLTFQTMVADLCGLDLAGASLLDEATAAAEAMTMARRLSRVAGATFAVHADVHPQVAAVLATRAEPLGVAVHVADLLVSPLPDGCFGVLLPCPTSTGAIPDWRPVADAAHAAGALVVAEVDVLSLLLVAPPGSWGADLAVGSTQRFGVPMGFGGPHAAFLACNDVHARALPGRLVGASMDAEGRPALRLALQTREQHIRREKATSNICTAQVLLAVLAALYAVHHGPDGLRRIAQRVHAAASSLAGALRAGGVELVHDTWFDTVTALVPGRAAEVVAAALARDVNLRLVDADRVGITVDETTTPAVLDAVLDSFGVPGGVEGGTAIGADPIPLRRSGEVLTHPVFHRYHGEAELVRYVRRLADRDLALDRTMIPLGSCTMKLNAAAEMLPITWPEFADLHPFAPLEQAAGTLELIAQLESMLLACTGYDAISLQPNAGSQGELAGLLAIRAYHRSRGDVDRTVCLIPSSAHGTNAASAVMAGMSVVVVACREDGDVDLDDLRAKAATAGDRLAAVMVTYPSTHGVYEVGITDLCEIVHRHGGQVYVDGANLNALVGVAPPGGFGADVSHLNLHKTFCIPHGGGGPGVGPTAVKAHLAPFLPSHPVHPSCNPAGVAAGNPVGPVSAAPWGSAGILAIPWMYVRMMGPDGLRRATEQAVLSANYVARRLEGAFPVLYRGEHGDVAHECILDLRPLTKATGVTAEDVAKRLMDHGFHAPTLSFPVAGTLMVEPTESESRRELDRFCEAMLAIRAEIDRVAAGDWPIEASPLRLAPHTAEAVMADVWDRPYRREEAAYPTAATRLAKYWPPVARIDAAAGDRNLVCSCLPVEAYALR